MHIDNFWDCQHTRILPNISQCCGCSRKIIKGMRVMTKIIKMFELDLFNFEQRPMSTILMVIVMHIKQHG